MYFTIDENLFLLFFVSRQNVKSMQLSNATGFMTHQNMEFDLIILQATLEIMEPCRKMLFGIQRESW